MSSRAVPVRVKQKELHCLHLSLLVPRQICDDSPLQSQGGRDSQAGLTAVACYVGADDRLATLLSLQPLSPCRM